MFTIEYAEGVAVDLAAMRPFDRSQLLDRIEEQRYNGGNPVKTVLLEQATLDTCVREAQSDRVVVTRNGVPVALVVGVEGLDEEQVQLASSDDFWRMIVERRRQKALSRADLERASGGAE